VQVHDEEEDEDKEEDEEEEFLLLKGILTGSDCSCPTC